MSLRPLSPVLVNRKLEVPDERPSLEWLPIDLLRIESAYQRELTPTGLAVVQKIVRDFTWQRFGTLSVAPLEHGLYAVIDGQHRGTALATLGVDEAPCMVNDMSFEERARSFVAINSVNTPVTSIQKYWAAVAAKDDLHLEVYAACDRAGVRVLRYPVPTTKHRVGDTMAASALLFIGKAYGGEVLQLSLRMLTESGDGHPGLLVSQTIKACGKLVGEDVRLYNNPRDLIAAAATIDWPNMIRMARINADGKRFQAVLDAALRVQILKALDLPANKGVR